jgi:glycosyltransferase involved in cell wall biosynthesis
VIFLVTEDWYFCSHRLPAARAVRDAGAEVVVATRVDRHGERIAREGFRVVPLPWRRRSTNPWRELRALVSLVRLYRRDRPHVVHHVAVKPAVYGGVAALLGGRPSQVVAIAGFGYVSSSTQLRARLLRPLLRWWFRVILNRPEARLVVQNSDDAATASKRLFDPARVRVIRGSGVDTAAFAPSPEPDGPLRVVLVARMLRSKGIEVAVDAARLLRERASSARVVLAGIPDPENPESVAEATLRRWNDEGVVEWLGRVDDVAALWRGSHVAILPTSYHEGLPKALLEAAASARAVIASDIPGCREIVEHESNGLLIRPGDAGALASAIERLEGDAALRHAMGARGREMVEARFAEDIVARQTVELYTELMGR